MPEEEVRIEAVIDPKGAVAGARELNKSVEGLQKELELTGRQSYYAGMMLSQMGQTARVVGLAMMGATAGMIKAWSDFQQSMVNTAAVADATGEEFNRLSDTAMNMAGRTRFSAKEAADAMYFLASAGYNANEILSALGPIANLAAATLSTLDKSSQYVVTTLAAFDLRAEEAAHISNVFTSAIVATQATLERLGYSLAYVGPIAAEMGLSIEETVAALSALYDVGIPASTAGMALRMALSKLVDITPAATKKLAEFGLSVTDINPEVYKFADILENLRKAGTNSALAFELFGRRAAPAMMALINMGKTGFEEYINKVSQANKANEIAEKQLDTLQSSFKRMKDAIVAAGASLGSTAEGPLRFFADRVKGLAFLIQDSGPLFKGFITILTGVGGALVALTGQLGIFLGVLVSAGFQMLQYNVIMKNVGAAKLVLIGVLKKAGAALLNFKTITFGVGITLIGTIVKLIDATENYRKKNDEALRTIDKLANESINAARTATETIIKLRGKEFETVEEALERQKNLATAMERIHAHMAVGDETLLAKTTGNLRRYYFEAQAMSVQAGEFIAARQAEEVTRLQQLQANKYSVVQDADLKITEMNIASSQKAIALLWEEYYAAEAGSRQRVEIQIKLNDQIDKLNEELLKRDKIRDEERTKSFLFFANAIGGTTANLGNIMTLIGAEWATNWITNLQTILMAFLALQKAIAIIQGAIAAAQGNIISAAKFAVALALAITAGASAAIQMGSAIASIVKGTKAIEWQPVTMAEVKAPEAGKPTEIEVARFQTGGMTRAPGLAYLEANEVITPLEKALAGRAGAVMGGVTININVQGGMFDDPEYWRKITKDGVLPALREIGLAESAPNAFGYE